MNNIEKGNEQQEQIEALKAEVERLGDLLRTDESIVLRPELRKLWREWKQRSELMLRLRRPSNAAATRVCMDDLERVAEKYGWDVTKL